MKLQLDTTAKTIKLETAVNLKDLLELLEKLLPNGEWKKFILEANTTINNWSAPIIIRQSPTYPQYPWITYNTYTVGDVPNITASTQYSLNAGIYNVEC